MRNEATGGSPLEMCATSKATFRPQCQIDHLAEEAGQKVNGATSRLHDQTLDHLAEEARHKVNNAESPESNPSSAAKDVEKLMIQTDESATKSAYRRAWLEQDCLNDAGPQKSISVHRKLGNDWVDRLCHEYMHKDEVYYATN
ncbi:hypothetical protein KCU78_g2160, partial [Aureobasidium melanogenum]